MADIAVSDMLLAFIAKVGAEVVMVASTATGAQARETQWPQVNVAVVAWAIHATPQTSTVELWIPRMEANL